MEHTQLDMEKQKSLAQCAFRATVCTIRNFRLKRPCQGSSNILNVSFQLRVQLPIQLYTDWRRSDWLFHIVLASCNTWCFICYHFFFLLGNVLGVGEYMRYDQTVFVVTTTKIESGINGNSVWKFSLIYCPLNYSCTFLSNHFASVLSERPYLFISV